MLINKPEKDGKTYRLNDVTEGIVPVTKYFPDSNLFFGGRVTNFGKTKDGLLLCLEGNNVIGIFIPDGEKPLEEMDRRELIAKAKAVGVPGKIATMGTEDLIKAIMEAQNAAC